MEVKVWNDNVYPYEEKFKGQTIKIPAQGYIWMDKGEAKLFKGTFASIQRNNDGHPIPQGYKMIRIEEVDQTEADEKQEKTESYVCQMDGATFPTQKALDKYIEDNYKDHIVKDEAAEIEIAKKARPRGRPPKTASA